MGRTAGNVLIFPSPNGSNTLAEDQLARFGVGKKFPSLLSCFFTASLGFMVSAGEKKSRFENMAETRMEENHAEVSVRLGISEGRCPPGREITLSELDSLVDTPNLQQDAGLWTEVFGPADGTISLRYSS